jgi:uncharacterized protein YjbJ (UPF0337 family)
MTVREMVHDDQDRFYGDARVYWGKLTDSDLEQIDNNRDRLVGKLQERYGWSAERARREVVFYFGEKAS